MRNIASLFALCVGVAVTGCDTKVNSKSVADKKVDEAKSKVSEATEASVAAAKAKRDEYITSMQKKLDEWDARCKELDKEAAEAKDDAKKKLEDKAKAARVKRDEAAKKLSEAKDASDDRWEKIKDGIDNAFSELKKAFE